MQTPRNGMRQLKQNACHVVSELWTVDSRMKQKTMPEAGPRTASPSLPQGLGACAAGDDKGINYTRNVVELLNNLRDDAQANRLAG